MFAVVYLPQFSLQAALRHAPEYWAKPVALVDPERTTPVVCDLTESARTAGVTIGLTPTQALARCRLVRIHHRAPAQEAAATEALLQCAYGFSPHIESTGAGVCTLDLRGLSVLSAANEMTLAKWAGKFRTALSRVILRANVGIGPTPNISRHAARWSEGIQIIGEPAAFIAALPLAALEPSSDVASILHRWGIRTVGEMLALGQEALVERIGLEALALFAAASTTTARPLHLARPSERFEESMEFEHLIETSEPLLFVLRRFVEQLCQRLEFVGLVAATQTLRLRLESGEVLERRLSLPQPTRRTDVLFRMLQTHLENLRTVSPIVALMLTFGPSQPEQRQFSLFEAALRDPHQFQETLARLAGLLGAERVGTPVLEDTHRPDAFRLVPPDFENAPIAGARPQTDLGTPLAIRRFRPAIKAQVESGETTGTEIARPLSIRCTAAHGKLSVALGPWRASGQWWEPGAWRREEWDVSTRGGAVLRLSKRLDGWFVDGVLD